MANIPTYDPLSSEIRSPLIAGEIEALNKISQILNMETEIIQDVALEEVYIADDDRYRIYQAPTSNRLWLKSPEPVIKINGTIKTPSSGYYEIDYVGGSIAFQGGHTLTASDTVSVSATIIKAGSATINGINDDISALTAKSNKYKGYYETVAALNSAYSTGENGDFALIGGNIDSFYVWDEATKAWKPASAETDLSDYYTKQEVDSSLSAKEAKIEPKGQNTSDDDYYYGGRKQWIDLLYKIKNFVLTGLLLNNTTDVQATDTLLAALGKLQAQISAHRNNTSNPHAVNKSQIGLNLVDNTSDMSKPVSTAQQEAIDGAKKLTNDHITDKDNPHEVTAAQVGARPVTWTPSASDVGADPAGSATTVQNNLNTHAENTVIHTTQAEKTAWNSKADVPLILTGVDSDPLDEAKAAFASGRQVIYNPHDIPTVFCDNLKKMGSASYYLIGFNASGRIYYNVLVDTGGSSLTWKFSECQTNDMQLKPTEVTGSGAVNVALANNTEYSYTNVTSLTMAAAQVDAHGFITFASSAPTINVTGFAGASGDDITSAAAAQVWEFSIYAHNGGAYIIWKNWSA